MPDWGKMAFTKYPGKTWEEILPDCEPEGRDLVSKLSVYESGNRLTAAEVCSCVTGIVTSMLTGMAGTAASVFPDQRVNIDFDQLDESISSGGKIGIMTSFPSLLSFSFYA